MHRKVTQLRDVRESKRLLNDIHTLARRVEAEERAFMSFLRTMPVIGWLKDYTEGGTGRMIFLSDLYADKFGRAWHDYVGKTDYDVWPSEVADQFREHDLKVLSAGRMLEFRELVNVNGEDHPLTVQKWPIITPTMRLVGGLAWPDTKKAGA